MEQCSIENYLDTAIDSIKEGRLEEIFETCIGELGVAPEQMKKQQRLELVTLLSQHHAFDYQKAVPYVAGKLGVSRYTVYNYLKKVESSSPSSV
jgi:predicted transcriptional regulator YheO